MRRLIRTLLDDLVEEIFECAGGDEEEMRRAAADAGAVGYLLKENLLGIRRMISGE